MLYFSSQDFTTISQKSFRFWGLLSYVKIMCLYCHSSVLTINCHLFDLYSIDVLKSSTSFFFTHRALYFSFFIEIVLFYVHYAYFYCKPSRILLLSLFTWTSCVFPRIIDCLLLHFLNFLLPYFPPTCTVLSSWQPSILFPNFISSGLGQGWFLWILALLFFLGLVLATILGVPFIVFI